MKKYLLLFSLLIIFHFSSIAQSWGWYYLNQLPLGYGQVSMEALNEDTLIVVGEWGSIQKTIDGGTTWNIENSGTTKTLTDIQMIDKDTGYIVGFDGLILKTINCGLDWLQKTSNTSNHIMKCYIKSPQNIWAIGDNGTVINSVDYGNSWNVYTVPTNVLLNNIGFINDTIIIIGNSGTVLKSTDDGISWQTINCGLTDDLFSLNIKDSLVYFLTGPSTIYQHDGNALYSTHDLITYNNIDIFNITPYYDRDIFFINDSVGFIFSTEFPSKGNAIDIWKTTDYGNTWDWSFHDYNTGYISYKNGIKFINDTIGFFVTGMEVLKTNSAGIYTISQSFNSDNTISIYPNPTSGKTNIETESILGIELYNLQGERINFKRIDTEIDLSNNPKGIYFVKVTTKDGVAVQKVIKN